MAGRPSLRKIAGKAHPINVMITPGDIRTPLARMNECVTWFENNLTLLNKERATGQQISPADAAAMHRISEQLQTIADEMKSHAESA